MISLRVLSFLMLLPAPAMAQDPPAPVVLPITPGVLEASRTPSIQPIPEVWAPIPVDGEGRSAYGLYLTGRAALRDGQPSLGATYLGRAGQLAPEQPSLREQGFIAAVMAGDLEIARLMAPEGEGHPALIVEAGKLVRATEMMATGDAEAAWASLRAEPVKAPHLRAGRYLQTWLAAAAGEWDDALSPLPQGADPATAAIDRLHRAQILEYRGDMRAAEAEYQGLIALPGAAGAGFQRTYGGFLERRGRKAEAIAAYDAAVAGGPQGQDPLAGLAKQRIEQGGRPPRALDARTGAAQALADAAAQAKGDGSNEFAVVYYRLAQRLAPSEEGFYLLGQTLGEAGLSAAGREALAQVPEGEAELFAAAQAQIGLSLEREDRDEEALAAFRRAVAARPQDPQLALLLTSQMMALERYQEAIALLEGPVLNTAEQGPDVHFLRGAAYESVGRIPEAEAQLWASLQARPDDANTLNYLGYLWVDNGQRVAEGADMIARAHAAAPENGNIQDSLGWAQYRQGQYALAVSTLEQAVAKEPANAEINDHLGDAYWRVGRQREAGFQWTRVLTLDPDAERKASVERKLANGLEAGEDANGS